MDDPLTIIVILGVVVGVLALVIMKSPRQTRGTSRQSNEEEALVSPPPQDNRSDSLLAPDVESLDNLYSSMPVAALADFESRYNAAEFTADANEVINRILIRRRPEIEAYRSTPEEPDPPEQAKGIAWKVYFWLFLAIFGMGLLVTLQSTGIGLARYLLSSVLWIVLLYSWIWAKRISWLRYLRWLIQFYSVVLPLVILVFAFVFAIQGIATSKEPADVLGIVIVLLYVAFFVPGLYAVFKISWHSRLLYQPESSSTQSEPSFSTSIEEREGLVPEHSTIAETNLTPPLPEKVTSRPDTFAEHEIEKAVVCPECGKVSQSSYRFCPACGAILTNILCTSCGREIEIDSRFCPHCGSSTQG